MEGTAADFRLNDAIIEPATRHTPKETGNVRPDVNRVIYSPLVNVTISQTRQVPFGCLAVIPLMEEWFPINDIPPHARHRVSPDPGDSSTWGDLSPDKLPKPKLASALVNSDLILARVLQTYADQGCREITTLCDKSSAEIRTTQQKLFGAEQIRTYLQTVAAIKKALDTHSDDRLVVGAAREIMKQSEEALRACELYWQNRKVEIMRAANGDKEYTAHPDRFDLRVCEFAGIDPTMTEAEALRAEVLKGQLQPAPVAPAVPTPEAFTEAMKVAVAEGVKVGIAEGMKVAQESKPVTPASEPPKGNQRNNR